MKPKKYPPKWRDILDEIFDCCILYAVYLGMIICPGTLLHYISKDGAAGLYACIHGFCWGVGTLFLVIVAMELIGRTARLSGHRDPTKYDKTEKTPYKEKDGLSKLFRSFKWLCSKENREHIELITADLKKDAKKMRREKHSEIFVKCVLAWHVWTTILAIIWDGSRRFLAAVIPVGKMLSKIRGL